MSKETIERIREAETQADRLIAEAEERARTMRADAEAEGRALCETAEREVTEQIALMLEQIRTRTGEMEERIMEEAQTEAGSVADTARLNRKSAEKLVIRGLDAKCR